MREFNSEAFFEHIKTLADSFYEASEKNFVKYDSKGVERAKKAYLDRLLPLKREIYGQEDPAGKRIDRHKVTALYIQLFLEMPLFETPKSIRSEHGPGAATMLINEMFCLRIMNDILESWCGASIDRAKFAAYRKSFFRLLYRYREQAEFHKRNVFFTFALAHVIYLVECYFTTPLKIGVAGRSTCAEVAAAKIAPDPNPR
jgi:hypothetical protein